MRKKKKLKVKKSWVGEKESILKVKNTLLCEWMWGNYVGYMKNIKIK